jgi:membrane protein
MTSIRRWATVIGRSARKWYGDDAPELGAALAYYSLFAVAPLLVIAAAMAGIAFSDAAVRLYLESQLAHEIGMVPAKALLAMAEIAANPPARRLAFKY